MKAHTALLLCLTSWVGSASAADEPDAPQSLPIVYTQPGTRFVLSIDNRRYEIDNSQRDPVAQAFPEIQSNLKRAKQLWDDYKKILAEKAKFQNATGIAKQQVNRDDQKVDRIRAEISTLKSQLSQARSSRPVDLQRVNSIQAQIQYTNDSLAQAEKVLDKSEKKLADAQKAAEANQQNIDKAREAFLAAEGVYDKSLDVLRKIAKTQGRQL